MGETNGPMTQLCNTIDFKYLIARHNDPADDYHLDLHSVVCLGAQWNKGNTLGHYALYPTHGHRMHTVNSFNPKLRPQDAAPLLPLL
jgi:hypothetical protein